MKYIFSFIILVVLFAFRLAGGIYDITLNSIDGNKIDLNTCRGKKILFVVLPLSATDTTLSRAELLALQTKYKQSLVIIGLVAEEAGYKKSQKAGLKELYGDQNGFLLTEPLHVKKGPKQSPLLSWLTTKDKNQHFDQDVQGVGQKFFVNEEGQLYGVLGPHCKLSNPVIDRVLSRQAVKTAQSHSK